jgi:hypothetical protein
VGASLEICSKRGVIAVLASGVVISLTALTGGLAPAYAKPGTDPLAPTTTTVPVPEPQVKATQEPTAAQVPPAAPPKVAVESSSAPTQAPVEAVAPPSVASPPQTQTPEPPPVTVQTTSAPTTTVNTPATSAAPPAPRVAAPSATEPPPVTTTVEQPVTTTAAQSPKSAASATPSAPVATSGSATPSSAVSVPPSAALVAPPSEASQPPTASSTPAAPTSGSPTPATETKSSSSQRTPGVATSSSSTVSQAAKVIQTEQPQTLQAPTADVELAKNANAIEAKPDPAPKQDVDSLATSLNLNLGGRDGAGVNANADVRLASQRDFDRPARQWSPDWVQYDEYYRPVILNPYHDAVRIVYVYQDAPRIVWIPPLARIVLDVAQFAAYSFTAVVDTAANIVNAAVQTVADVAVGSFFGGGYVPDFGQPLPPPPPPVLRYDNVPVQVRYSQATYEPFRVQRVVDVGDDPSFGERKVLLDGATPVWGQWTQTATGERQFEVHRTQQYPGLDNPQEAPLPGNYQMTLASDNAPSGLTGRDIFLIVTAAVIAILGFGAIGMSIYLGRRRRQR